MYKNILVVLMALCFAVTFNPFAKASEEEPQRYLIQTDHIQDLQEKYTLQLVRQVRNKPVYEISADAETAGELARDPLVGTIQINASVRQEPVSTVNGRFGAMSLTGSQAFQSMGFPEGIYGRNKVIVAVLDTGIDMYHPEFAGKIEGGYNAVNPEATDPIDGNGHGTHVAGILAWDQPNSLRIMPVKVLDDDGYGDSFSIVDGIYYAIEHGADIINLSLGFMMDVPVVREAVKEAVQSGIHVVAASGNNGGTPIMYPARYEEVIAVGAYDESEIRATFSQYGDGLDFIAPGTRIYTAAVGGGNTTFTGTSAAVPFVVRAISVLMMENPLITQEEVVNLLQDHAMDMGPSGKDPYYGYGKLQVAETLVHSFDRNRNDSIDLYDLVRYSKGSKIQSHIYPYYGYLLSN